MKEGRQLRIIKIFDYLNNAIGCFNVVNLKLSFHNCNKWGKGFKVSDREIKI